MLCVRTQTSHLRWSFGISAMPPSFAGFPTFSVYQLGASSASRANGKARSALSFNLSKRLLIAFNYRNTVSDTPSGFDLPYASVGRRLIRSTWGGCQMLYLSSAHISEGQPPALASRHLPVRSFIPCLWMARAAGVSCSGFGFLPASPEHGPHMLSVWSTGGVHKAKTPLVAPLPPIGIGSTYAYTRSNGAILPHCQLISQ